jgi:hypothetical protein
MSVTRVLVFENQVSWAENMKRYKAVSEPFFKQHRKEKTLNSWSIVQTGENMGFAVFNFENKAKMNKFLKTANAHRSDVAKDLDSQFWAYAGTVKANG